MGRWCTPGSGRLACSSRRCYSPRPGGCVNIQYPLQIPTGATKGSKKTDNIHCHIRQRTKLQFDGASFNRYALPRHLGHPKFKFCTNRKLGPLAPELRENIEVAYLGIDLRSIPDELRQRQEDENGGFYYAVDLEVELTVSSEVSVKVKHMEQILRSFSTVL